MSLDNQSRLYLAATYPADHFGCRQMVTSLGKADFKTWSESDFIEKLNLSAGLAKRLARTISELDLSEYQHQLARLGIRLVWFDQPEFPRRFETVPDPPSYLFVKGQVEALNRRSSLALVGTRKPNSYGKTWVSQIVEVLAKNRNQQACIVSGLAFGIDYLSHRAALEHNLNTVAVLAHGLDSIQPRSNHPLADQIVAQGGALVSEYPLGIGAMRHHFPARNRLIAALVDEVIVIQGRQNSGSLHTAKWGRDYQRQVWGAVGAITSELSQAPHQVILDGGLPLIDPKRQWMERDQDQQLSLKPLRAESDVPIWQHIPDEGIGLVDLTAKLDWDIAEINMQLTQLEIEGLIEISAGRIEVK